MKNIKNYWFLMKPLDSEHKEYVLLDYLKNLSKDIKPENCYNILRSVSNLSKQLNDFNKNKKINLTDVNRKNKKDFEYLYNFDYEKISIIEKREIDSIISKSLETLYEYSDIFMDMLKYEESKIKIYKLEKKTSMGDLVNTTKNATGFLIVRNMITDKITNYFWKSSIRMPIDNGFKEVSVLKKMDIRNPVYSMSYEFIYHEILEQNNINNAKDSKDLDVYILEIKEDFDDKSEIYKLAKDKFIDIISNKKPI